MADDKAEFEVELLDDVSKPAKKADSALMKLKRTMAKMAGGALFRLGRRISKIGGPGGTFSRLGRTVSRSGIRMQRFGTNAMKATEKVGKGAKDAGDRFGFLKQTMSFVAGGAILGGLARIKDAVLGVSMSLVRGATNAIAFRDSTLRSLRLITKSAVEAKRIFSSGLGLADLLGQDPEKVIGGVNRLMAKGFDSDFSENIIRGLSDLKTVIPTANLDNAILAIEQIKSKGVLQMEELQGQLAEAGLNVSSVLDAIGKDIGKSAKDVRKLISAGKISADQGIMGVLTSIQELTGKPLGKAAEEASRGVQGFLDRFKNLPQRFFLALANEIDTGPIIDRMQAMWERFGPGSGFFENAVGIAVKVIDFLFEAFDKVIPLVEEFTDGFGMGLKEIVPAIEQFANKGAGLFEEFTKPETLQAMFEIGVNLGKVAGFVGLLGAAVIKALPHMIRFQAMMQNFAMAITEPILGILGMVFDWGRQIVDGLIEGIKSMFPDFKSLAASLSDAFTSSMRGPAGFNMHSPSKKTEKLGVDAGLGFNKGAIRAMASLQTSNLMHLPKAIANDNARLPAPTLRQDTRRDGARGGAMTFAPVINVQAQPGATREDGQALGQGLRDELEAQWHEFIEGLPLEETG